MNTAQLKSIYNIRSNGKKTLARVSPRDSPKNHSEFFEINEFTLIKLTPARKWGLWELFH